MQIAPVTDLSSDLAETATALKSSQVQTAIRVAVLKQTLDQQKLAGDALVKMLSQNPVSPNHIDVLA